MMIGLGLLGAACGGGTSAGDAKRAPRANPGGEPAVPVESTTAAAPSAVGAMPEVVQDRTGAPRVLFLGTSLTAGYGLDDPAHDSWPAVIQHIADSLHVPLDGVNAGLSGETSAGALRRTEWLLKQHADLVVIETGANDGLRGLNSDSTAANLRAIIGKIRAAQPAAKLLLVQMEAPTNLGSGYTQDFHALYGRVARDAKIPLSPFLLDGVAGVRTLNQADGIHPLPEGARRAARTMWKSIRSAIGRP